MSHNANDTAPGPTSSIVQPLQDVSLSLLTRILFLSILRIARTCHAVRLAVRDYFSWMSDVDERLSQFFNDPLAFWSLQALSRSKTVEH
ncbi:hypothetical protein BDY19DRAFT_998830 [Irpex rosettiformis]|uniref:Uncharacterized protein n=1 Tax=Irpex rosettiformis TaxID=378272 RepID=A0ACB8TMC5_9APHY|nr:hypothetical protein BDY19DRAFT_998830 [Irpex rosettiformis]